MKVRIIYSSNTDKKLEDCYDIISDFLQKVVKDESDLCKGEHSRPSKGL